MINSLGVLGSLNATIADSASLSRYSTICLYHSYIFNSSKHALRASRYSPAFSVVVKVDSNFLTLLWMSSSFMGV